VFRFPARATDFSLLQTFQTSSGIHPASYSLDTGAVFAGSKRTVEWKQVHFAGNTSLFMLKVHTRNYLMFVWQCITKTLILKKQLDATITVY
jgi:hypothetical protein